MSSKLTLFRPFRSLQYRILSSILSRNDMIFRLGHTDIKVPDFTKHMRHSVADPKSDSAESIDGRRLMTYMLTGMLWTGLMYGTKAEIIRYVEFMAPSAEVLALARIEIDLSQIAEDKHMTYKWRGKPLFVWHRTEESIKQVRSIPLSILRDPQEDAARVKDPKWLVVIGVCTHLGCVPISHQGDFGGYYCPCHGSHFDISGRARKGPAPTNLEVPEYTIVGDTLTVG
ncbi:cytochrome b-c1 complex subunit Rieske, mitochondrial-like [Sitophilus oryzae]|uniref:Cytochrome b-c1 complex subunit Rieske, mitochondrial n=1 Tax=Sitophilus oryzae TaxID=7048 RepID=A0A6J2XKW8_SITOR|nr:cytochrome b-c1 complex subunit Rieske, mitochondrial-like [Sitophilus oryzae]